MQAKKVRSLFSGFALVVGLAILAAPAFGQGVQFQVSSLPQQARIEGLTETMGAVVIQATTTNGTVKSGSSITVLYSGSITSPANGQAAVVGSACAAALPAGAPGTNCTVSGTVGGVNQGSGGVTGITVSINGNALTIAFTADKAFSAAGDNLVISQVRVNVNGLGAAVGSVTATLSGTSALPTTNPITFTNATVPVASIVNPSLNIGFNGNSLTTPALQTCGVNTSNFNIIVAERYPAALTITGQEAGFTPSYTVVNGTTVTVALAGVPTGMGVVFSGVNAGVAGSAAAQAAYGVNPPAPAGSTIGVTASSAFQAGNGSFTFTITGGATSLTEAFELDFKIGSLNSAGTALSGTSIAALGTTQNITATVSLGPVQAANAGPVSFAANTQGSGTIATIGDCVTNLLFPFVTNQVGFDTSIQISNTSSDALAFSSGNANKANGVCTLTLYPTDLTTQTATAAGTVGTPSQITTPNIPSGGVVSFLQSGTSFKGQSGYVLAVCRFLDAHGFGFVLNGPQATATISQGLLALVIPNNSISNGRVNTIAAATCVGTSTVAACTGAGCANGAITQTCTPTVIQPGSVGSTNLSFEATAH